MRYASLLLVFFVLFLYLYNLSAGVYGGDVGDFVSAASVWGVAHPPGYPLFVFLGALFLKIPLSMTPVMKMGLISVFSSFFSVLLMYLIVRKISKSYLLPLLASLTLAFSYLFWLYAELPEAFALNSFFALFIFYLSLAYKEKKEIKIFYFLCFFVGLSLTHHHTIVFVFPSVLILIIDKKLLCLLKPSVVMFSLLFFVLGLLPYLYAPIASSFNPAINWSDPSSLDNFIKLITRADYNYIPNTGVSLEQRFLTLKLFYFQLIKNLTLPVLIFSLLGVFEIYKTNKRLLFAIFSVIFFSGPFFLLYGTTAILDNYRLGVIERFYILPSIFIILLFPFGIILLNNILEELFARIGMKKILREKLWYLFVLIFFFIPVFLFVRNVDRTHLSNVWLGDYLAQDILEPMDYNSVVILAGDTPVFNSWYLRYALKERTDIEIINLGTYDKNKFFIEKKKEVIKKYKNLSDNDILVRTVEEIGKKNFVYSNITIQYEKPDENNKLYWVPTGLTYKLYTKNSLPNKDELLKINQKIFSGLKFDYKNYVKKSVYSNATLADVPSYYADGLVAVADYLLIKFNDTKEANKYYEAAIELYPMKRNAYFGLGYSFLSQKECKKAEDNFNEAVSLDPSYTKAYQFLYLTYLYCFENNDYAQKLEKQYGTKFKSSLKEDILKFN